MIPTSQYSAFSVLLGIVAVIGIVLGSVAQSSGEASVDRPGVLPVAIIVHPSNSSSPEISIDQLRALFTLRTRFWPDGRAVRLVLPSRKLRERDVLLDKVYHMDSMQLALKWQRRIFAGEITSAPYGAASPEALVRAVASNPGAVAAVRLSAVGDGVRILRVDGRMPGDEGYFLGQ